MGPPATVLALPRGLRAGAGWPIRQGGRAHRLVGTGEFAIISPIVHTHMSHRDISRLYYIQHTHQSILIRPGVRGGGRRRECFGRRPLLPGLLSVDPAKERTRLKPGGD